MGAYSGVFLKSGEISWFKDWKISQEYLSPVDNILVSVHFHFYFHLRFKSSRVKTPVGFFAAGFFSGSGDF
jgi:hypothetical protein